MPYKFKVWCPDCYGEDPYGCFGGDFELSEETYETIEAAVEAADEYVKDSIWDWSIVEVSSENPNEIIREYSDDYLVAYSLPNGQALDAFNLPPHTKRREQEKDRARSPTRLEGMETNFPRRSIEVFKRSPTRLEGMETKVPQSPTVLVTGVSDPP